MAVEMQVDIAEEDNLLRKPFGRQYQTPTRRSSSYHPLPRFDLAKGSSKHYRQQYGDMYFLRLARLKPVVEAVAQEAWDDYELAGESVRRVDRVLDVRQGELCWVAGTVYKDMPLKPNILDDISKDHWTAAPPPREKYVSPDGLDKIMLEDESGRLRLIGAALESELLVTGCIIAVMGTEASNGDFEVIDIKIPDLPSQPERWALEPASKSNDAAASADRQAGKVAIISGLSITGESGETLNTDLLMEFLLGESTSPTLQSLASQISRLVIAGDSLAEATPLAREELPTGKKAAAAKKYGYDASAYNPAPTQQLDLLLSTILPSLPITLIPGASDPANVSIPQQPLHPALFPQSRAYAAAPPTVVPTKTQPTETGSFHSTTNPALFSLSGHLFLGTGGQPTDDIGKYVEDSTTLELMESTLRWRLLAPTAPDTLWCYPFQSDDPFVLQDGLCPHVYIVGNQPSFCTGVIQAPNGSAVRLVSVPRFSETGELILVDEDTLDVEVVRFGVHEEIV